MTALFLIFFVAAALLLLADTFSTAESNRAVSGPRRAGFRLLPLALFFWVLVPLIQTARSL
jgi:hypothetical protein